MIKINHGVIVKPRMNGNEKSIPMPKSIPIDMHANYIIRVKKSGLQITKLKRHHNVFSNPEWNAKNVRPELKKANLNDNGHSMGREL